VIESTPPEKIRGRMNDAITISVTIPERNRKARRFLSPMRIRQLASRVLSFRECNLTGLFV
jgi:hypothetical protein